MITDRNLKKWIGFTGRLAVVSTALILGWNCIIAGGGEAEVPAVKEWYFTRQTHANYILLDDNEYFYMRGYENDGVDCIILKNKASTNNIALDCDWTDDRR